MTRLLKRPMRVALADALQGPHSLREQPSRVLVTDPHLLKMVSKRSVDATPNGAQRTFRFLTAARCRHPARVHRF